MSAVETETRNCGKCEYFDRNGVDGKPAGTRELFIDSKSQQVPLGYCRGPRGLSLRIRAEVMTCSNDQFRNIPVSIAEVHPEKIPA